MIDAERLVSELHTTPANVANTGDPVSTSEAETWPSLSRDGKMLYSGRAPAAGGPADVSLATRTRGH